MNKVMELAEKEMIRKSVLEIAEQSGINGASNVLVKKALAKNGMQLTDEQLARETSYLAGKELITVEHIENKVLEIERDMIKLTPKGMDVLDGVLEVEGIGE